MYAIYTQLNLRNIKMSSFKSSENIQKKEGGPARSVSDYLSSSVALNELAMKARQSYNFKLQILKLYNVVRLRLLLKACRHSRHLTS